MNDSADNRGRGREHPRDPNGSSDPNDRSDPDGSPDPDEPIALPIEDELDLHTFRPRDILDVVDSYLEAASEAGLEEVRVVHGKGTGFQRERVQKLLETHPLVESYRDAPGHRGHWGATFVRLRKPERT